MMSISLLLAIREPYLPNSLHITRIHNIMQLHRHFHKVFNRISHILICETFGWHFLCQHEGILARYFTIGEASTQAHFLKCSIVGNDTARYAGSFSTVIVPCCEDNVIRDCTLWYLKSEFEAQVREGSLRCSIEFLDWDCWWVWVKVLDEVVHSFLQVFWWWYCLGFLVEGVGLSCLDFIVLL